MDFSMFWEVKTPNHWLIYVGIWLMYNKPGFNVRQKFWIYLHLFAISFFFVELPFIGCFDVLAFTFYALASISNGIKLYKEKQKAKTAPKRLSE